MADSILQEADGLINGQRQQDYGSPLENFTNIATMWSVILGTEVAAEDVALCMAALKICRARRGYHRDSLVDLAGYSGCIELIQKGRTEVDNEARTPLAEVDRPLTDFPLYGYDGHLPISVIKQGTPDLSQFKSEKHQDGYIVVTHGLQPGDRADVHPARALFAAEYSEPDSTPYVEAVLPADRQGCCNQS